MTKNEVDTVITYSFKELSSKSKSIMLTATLPVDGDVLSYAYEKTIQEAESIDTPSQVKSFYLQHVKFAATKKGSEYQRKNNRDKEIGDIDNISCSSTFTLNDSKTILDEFISKKCNNSERLLATLMMQGYSSSGKLSEYTKIPRSTCHMMLSELKKKIVLYVKENHLENEINEILQ